VCMPDAAPHGFLHTPYEAHFQTCVCLWGGEALVYGPAGLHAVHETLSIYPLSFTLQHTNPIANCLAAAYVRVMNRLVNALEESIQAEANGAKENEVGALLQQSVYIVGLIDCVASLQDASGWAASMHSSGLGVCYHSVLQQQQLTPGMHACLLGVRSAVLDAHAPCLPPPFTHITVSTHTHPPPNAPRCAARQTLPKSW
jgi:hypothetical protein